MIDYINWWEKNKELGLDNVKTRFIDLFSKADLLPSIYHPILYKYLKNHQMKHWDDQIFTISREKIYEIESNLGKDVMHSCLLSNFQLLVYAYESVLDLEDRIMMMNRFKGNEEIKTKIFSINIYNDLLNTAFSATLKLFIAFQGLIEGKDLSQKTLTPQIECLASPNRGYKTITDLADSNIRNAISHGGVKATGSEIIFTYRQGADTLQQKSTIYSFKDSMLQLYDGVTAIILAWVSYLCEENISYNEIYENDSVHEDTKRFFEKLSLSTLDTTCDKIWQVRINDSKDSRNQVNVFFSGADLNIESRIFLGLNAVQRIFQLRKLSINDTIMISFSSPKVANSFFIVKGSTVDDLINNTISLEEAWKEVVLDNNVLMFPINEENRNIYEDDFRYYPDIETEDFLITEIEDISLEDKKRLKAVVYLKRAKRPSHVKADLVKIINSMKWIENYGFTSHKVKHGTMEADIIYLVLYKREVRRGKDRALYPNNDNFIAQIQYDLEMKFPIRNNFIDPVLKKRREKTIEYNWNPNF